MIRSGITSLKRIWDIQRNHILRCIPKPEKVELLRQKNKKIRYRILYCRTSVCTHTHIYILQFARYAIDDIVRQLCLRSLCSVLSHNENNLLDQKPSGEQSAWPKVTRKTVYLASSHQGDDGSRASSSHFRLLPFTVICHCTSAATCWLLR